MDEQATITRWLEKDTLGDLLGFDGEIIGVSIHEDEYGITRVGFRVAYER